MPLSISFFELSLWPTCCLACTCLIHLTMQRSNLARSNFNSIRTICILLCTHCWVCLAPAYAARFVPMLLKKRQECGSTKSPTRPMIRKRAKFQEHKSCSNLSCTVHHSVQLNRTHTLSFHFKTWHSSRKFLFCGGDRNDNLPKSPRKSMMLWVACLEVWNQCRYCISNFAVSKTATTPNSNVA